MLPTFNGKVVSRKMLEWAMGNKEIPEVLVRSVIIMYDGAKTRVGVDSELSEEFVVKVEMHQGSEHSPVFCTCGRCCH